MVRAFSRIDSRNKRHAGALGRTIHLRIEELEGRYMLFASPADPPVIQSATPLSAVQTLGMNALPATDVLGTAMTFNNAVPWMASQGSMSTLSQSLGGVTIADRGVGRRSTRQFERLFAQQPWITAGNRLLRSSSSHQSWKIWAYRTSLKTRWNPSRKQRPGIHTTLATPPSFRSRRPTDQNGAPVCAGSLSISLGRRVCRAGVVPAQNVARREFLAHVPCTFSRRIGDISGAQGLRGLSMAVQQLAVHDCRF